MVADGTGAPARRAEVLVRGDRVAAVGTVPPGDWPELDAEGAVVAPGFINVLSQAYETLQQDPRGLSDLYQGVTTEVFGEGWSLGPVTGRMTEIAESGRARTGCGTRGRGSATSSAIWQRPAPGRTSQVSSAPPTCG